MSNNTMALLCQKGREDLLQPHIDQAKIIDPHSWEVLFYQATVDELLGKFTDAIQLRQQLQNLHPHIDPYGLGLARAYLANMELDRALEISNSALQRLKSAEAFIPHAFNRTVVVNQFHIVLAEIFLRKGDARGFAYQLAQTAVRCPSYIVPNIPIWRNESIKGRHLLVTAAAGYGDQLLFAALLPELAQQAARITFVVHPDLEALFKIALPGVSIIPEPMATTLCETPSLQLMQRIADDAPDLQANLFQLPLLRMIARTSESFTFPAYLSVPQQATDAAQTEIAALRAKANGRKLIGIAWDRIQRHHPDIVGAVESARTARSSLPPELLVQITDAKEIQEHFHFVALHEHDQQRAWPNQPPKNITATSICGGDFAYTAALIDACSLVISVDMSVANLAAMLGKETWVMLCHEGDWRWGTGLRSPWIANTRSIRQPHSGAWQDVIDRVLQQLSVLALQQPAELRIPS